MDKDKAGRKNSGSSNPQTGNAACLDDYKLLFNNSTMGGCIVNCHGDILDFNKSIKSMLGFSSSEELKKVNLLNFKPFVNNGFVSLFHESLKHSKVIQKELRYISPKEKEKFLNIRLIPLTSASGEAAKISVIIGDVTDHVKERKIVEESEKKFRKIFKISPDAVSISQLEDGKYIEINDGFTNITGYTPREIIGKTIRDIDIWVDKYDRIRLLKIIKKEGSVKNFSTRFRIKNGKIIHSSMSANIIKMNGIDCLLTVTHNIEDFIKVNEALQQSELKFRKAFKTSMDAININRIEDGKYLEINKGFTAITGYTEEDTLGKTSLEVGIWADEKELEELEKLLEANGSVYNFQAHFRTKNGKIIHGLMSANIVSINGTPCLLSISRNIENLVQTSEALKQSELKFRKAFAISPNALAITHLRTGQYLDVNEGFLKETGYKREEIIGKTALELNIWSNFSQRKNLENALKKNGFVKDMPVSLRMKDGKIVRGLVSSNLIDIDGEPHLISITRNIEDLLKATEASVQSERRYEKLFNASPAGIILIDNLGTIIEANPTYCKNIGYKIEEIIGEKIWNLISNPYADKKEDILEFIPSIPENKIVEKEVVNTHKNGELVYLHLYETRIRLKNDKSVILSISVDVTQEKQYRQELIRQAEHLQEAQNIGRLGSWELNWKNKKLSWSYGIYQILEISQSRQPDYGDFQQHIHPDDLPGAREILKESVKSGEPFKHIHRLLLAHGKIKWVMERGKSFYDARGKIIRTHGTIQDITRLKEAEDKLKELNEQLEEKVRDRTSRLKKKQQDLSKLLNDVQQVQQELRKSNNALQNLNHELESFSYSVSHDLKAPLRAIRGFSTILKEDYYPVFDEEGKTLVEDILKETAGMSEIIDALLQLSRTGRKNLNYVTFDLTPLVKSVFTEQQKHQNLPHAELIISGLPLLYADYSLVKQLMANLLSNALKYSSKETLPVVEIGCNRDKQTGETTFYVKDNGVGFDEALSEKMFDAFQRLHSRKEFSGTGIGLAIAKRIVTRHDGKIWAKSKKGEGATFFFSLSKNDKTH